MGLSPRVAAAVNEAVDLIERLVSQLLKEEDRAPAVRAVEMMP